MSDGTIEEPASVGALLNRPFFWISVAAAVLTCFLYYPLFFPPTHVGLALQGEEFFFEANEAAGAPVLVLSAWLFYRRSHYLDLLWEGRGESFAGGAVLALSALVYGWGHYTQASDLQLASVIGLLFGVVLCLGGRAAVRAFWLPILFLGFALPLSPVPLSAAIFPIQLVTSEYAGAILNLIGVKSLVQGDQILRPENTFIVIETCSGVRTIVTLTMLTVLLIDLFERRGWHAALLFVLAPFVAFLTNGFRVVTLVLNPHSSIHSIHNLQGIVMLLVGLSAMYMLDLAFERGLGTSDPVAEDRDHGTRAGGGAGRMAIVLATLLAMVAIGRFVAPFEPPSGLDGRVDDLIVRVFGDNASRVIEPDYQFRGSLRYLDHSNRLVRFEGETIEVFVGVANEIIRDHTLLSKRLAWPESGWVPIEESFVDLAAEAEGTRRMLFQRGGRTLLSYSWHPRAGPLGTEWLRQALALDRSPFFRDQHMLAIRISTVVGRGVGRLEEAEARVRGAWSRLEPALEGYAPMRPPS